MANLPNTAHIAEVGPRDGLQIETSILSVEQKLELIDALVEAGIREIEVGSFVNPKAVPQMANTEELLSRMVRQPGVKYRGLWLNPRGLNAAIATGKLDIEGILVITASETFVRRNTSRSIEDTFADMPAWIERYKAAGVEVEAIGVMAAFGCNFEGMIPADKIVDLVGRMESLMAHHGCSFRRLVLADTMGRGTPLQTKRLIDRVRTRWPDVELKLHLHDTRGAAVANAVAALELGVREFDSSIAGLGGCPFAGNKGASGNICTEDLAFVCEEMGISTGIDLEKLLAAARLAEKLVGRQLPGKLMRSGRALLEVDVA